MCVSHNATAIYWFSSLFRDLACTVHLMRSILALLVSVAMLACGGGRVLLRAQPPEARIRVNGIDVGRGEGWLEDKGSTGKTYRVEISAPGYETRVTSLRQEASGGCVAGWVIPGIFLWPFLLGLMQCWELPEESYAFELDRSPPLTASPPAFSPPVPLTAQPSCSDTAVAEYKSCRAAAAQSASKAFEDACNNFLTSRLAACSAASQQQAAPLPPAS